MLFFFELWILSTTLASLKGSGKKEMGTTIGLFLGIPQAKATPQGSTSVLTLFGICLQHTTNEGSGCHTVIHLAC